MRTEHDHRATETTLRELLDEFQAAVEIAADRRVERGGDDCHAALEGIEHVRRRILRYMEESPAA